MPATISRRCARILADWHAGGVMISRTGYGLAGLLILAAGLGLASHAAGGRADGAGREDHGRARGGSRRRPEADDADIKDLELDWSQLNVDASTLATGPASKARSPQAATGTRHVVVVQGQAERIGRGLGEAADIAVLGCPDRRRHDRRPAAVDDVGAAGGKGRQWRQRAAILRDGMGRGHRPRRRLDLGQDGGRSPRRSRAGAEQARHLPEQVAAAQRAVFAHPAERLQRDPAGHRPGARHRRRGRRGITRPSNRPS